MGCVSAERKRTVQFPERAVPNLRLYQYSKTQARSTHAIHDQRYDVFGPFSGQLHYLPLLSWRHEISGTRLDPAGLLFHIDQPYRAFDGGVAADPSHALVCNERPVPLSSRGGTLDFSSLALRFRD